MTFPVFSPTLFISAPANIFLFEEVFTGVEHILASQSTQRQLLAKFT